MRLTSGGVLNFGGTPAAPGAVNIRTTSFATALRVQANSPTSQNIGGFFLATGASNCYGIFADATLAAAGNNFGVYAQACNGNTNYALYGDVCNDVLTSWAGWFDGPSYTPGDAWTPSDENLKTNIADLSGASDMLMAMAPKSYNFREDVDAINLPSGLRYGLLSQELQVIIPHAVRVINTPEKYDEEGNVNVESLEFLGVNYGQIIPVLIAGFKEQSEQEAANSGKIQNLNNRLSTMENRIAISTAHTESQNESSVKATAQFKLKQNSPNPFETETRIQYEMETESMVQIDIVNVNGAVVESIFNGHVSSGAQSIRWNAENQPSGVYFCVIRSNGSLEAIKMIKR